MELARSSTKTWSAMLVGIVLQPLKDFVGIHMGALSLLEIALGMYPTSHFEHIVTETFVMIATAMLAIVVAIFLLNLLIA